MKINIKNTEKIAAELAKAQGKASARTVSVNDVRYEAGRIKKTLDAHNIPFKVRAGLTWCIDPNAQSFPASYRYKPESTYIFLTFGADGKTVFLTDAGRALCTPKRTRLMAKDEAEAAFKDAIVKNAFRQMN